MKVEYLGVSSTGTKHGLELTSYPKDGTVRFCITGVNGKRHATVEVSLAVCHEIAEFMEAADQEAAAYQGES